MDHQDNGRGGRISRGDLLRGIGSAAAVAGGVPLLGAAGSSDIASIAKLLNVDTKHTGKGMTFDLGAVFPVTGGGNIYGSRFADVPKLAFKHIEAMGGPKFNLIVKDNKSGDPQAGVQAVRELGFAKVPMMLSSYVADLGAMLSGIKQYKIFSLDGTGGTSLFAKERPYFFGTIAVTPNDALSGMVKYIALKMPQVKRVASVGWDLGGLSDMVQDEAKTHFATSNLLLATDERTKIGTTDYSVSIQKIKASQADLILLAVYAEDVGYFMKQYATSGINKPVITYSNTAASRQIAGKAYDGLYFAFDYFDASKPSNPWAKFFVSEYNKNIGGGTPENYGANTYEDVFTIWTCIQRVLAKGGNPKDGAQLEAALLSNPNVPSLYGGTASTLGVMSFDKTSHSVKHRPMSMSQYKNGKTTVLATYDIDGSNFKLV